MSTQPIILFSVDQYLELERKAEYRSEYLNGEIFAMAGGGRNHALIASETVARISEQLRGRSCAVAGSDLRLYCKSSRMLTYPDATVFCEPARFFDNDEDTLIDATVIVEVLSPSTGKYDRVDKFALYRGLPSFSDYLMLASDAVRAEHYVRQTDGSWVFREFIDPTETIELTSIDCRLTLGTLYSKATIKPPA